MQKERDPAEFNWKLSTAAHIFSREWPPKAVTPWANHFLMFISGKQTNMAAHRRAQIQSSNVCSINIDRTCSHMHFLFWAYLHPHFDSHCKKLKHFWCSPPGWYVARWASWNFQMSTMSYTGHERCHSHRQISNLHFIFHLLTVAHTIAWQKGLPPKCACCVVSY